MLLHLDADAFFAAVEQAADTRLRGKPIAVGGDKRGVISSASYEARRLGITGAMPTARARKICPKLIVLPPDFEKYELFSRRMFCYAHDFTPMVEIGSIDEGYLDLGGCRGKAPADIAETLRRAVFQSMKISISEGIGKNKLVAQIASKLRKPAGFIEVPEGDEVSFLHPLASTWLPGVGAKLGEVFRTAGLTTIAHVAATPPDALGLLAGAGARQLHAFAHGLDERPVITDPPAAKSYGTQETFDEDVTDEAFLLAKLRVMADTLMARVRGDCKAIRTVVVRVRYNDMRECQRSESLREPADVEHLIYPVLHRLLHKAWERRVSVRLLGVRYEQVYKGGVVIELPLDGICVSDEKRHRLAGVVDELRGSQFSIMRGHDFWLRRQGGKPRPSLIATPAPPAVRGSATNRVLLERPHSSPVRQRNSPRELVPLTALNLKSTFSFCDSLLTIPALVSAAVARGLTAIAITDPNLHGAVEFHQTAKAAGLHPVIGAELRCEGKSLNAYVENNQGYLNLCHLLSLRAGAVVSRKELDGHAAGLTIIDPASAALPEIRYENAADHQRYQIVQSIRTLTLLRERHPDKRKGTFHFPDRAEMLNRFDTTQWQQMADLAERCRFDFDLQTLRFPAYLPLDGSTPTAMLRRLAEEGLFRRYGPDAAKHLPQLHEELGIIGEVGYEEYFLAVWDILMECRKRGIAWITRGSAADSLVCYSLEISNVCPIRFELYFRRFLNRERMALRKLPDIDLDFAHDRKDDVMNLILERYGPVHSAIVGGFSTFQARSAVAEVAKVLGVSERDIRTLTTRLPHTHAGNLTEAIQTNHLSSEFPIHEEPYRTALATAAFLDGLPRYAKMHPCGIVVSRDPIRAFTPTFISQKGWPTTHFDMDSVEAVGLIKLDILAQGGLAVLRDTVAMLAERGVIVELENLDPWEDPGIWDMISTGQNRGVHHIESPAMCSLARMACVRDIDRLIAIVSVIRPGAANSLKKLEFCRRAQGLEEVIPLHPSLEPVLRSTFGVIAYEEHILQICEAFAGLNGGRSDMLRRALVKMDEAKVEEVGREFIASALALGRTKTDIRAVWELISGFQGYAFCRAHSTAYGVEAYQGALLKRYHPAEFMAAVLSNGKGFYSALTYTLECRRLGIGFRLPCLNTSRSGYQVEYGDGKPFIRVPLRAVKSLTEAMLARYAQERDSNAFDSIADFVSRVFPTPDEMLNLIRAGAFDTFGDSRPAQFWQARRLGLWPQGEALLFPATSEVHGLPETLEAPNELARIKTEMELFGFTVSAHPLDLYPDIAWNSYCPVSRLGEFPGQKVTVCGLIVEERLHRQSTGDPMKFVTLCDYTGFIECEIFADSYKRWGLATVRWPVIEVQATVAVFENGNGFTLNAHRIGKPRTTARSKSTPKKMENEASKIAT